MNKFLKLLLFLIVIVIVYILFLHEPAHYLSCVIIGGSPTFGMLGVNPAVNCVFNGASNLAKFFVFISPYLVDLFVLLIFLKVKRNKWTYFLPTVAFLNTIGCGLIAPIIQVQIGNDFVNMALINMLPYGLALVVLNVFLWFTFYGKDMIDKKRLHEILK